LHLDDGGWSSPRAGRPRTAGRIDWAQAVAPAPA